MTPEQLREKAMSDPTILRAMADQLQGRPMVADDVEWLLRAHAAALEEIERLREAGMREAATDARLIDWLEKALIADMNGGGNDAR